MPLRRHHRSTDTKGMTNPWFQLGAAFAGLVLFAVLSLEGKDIGQSLGVFEEDPVLVFTIPHPQHFERVRKAIADDRVVQETETGFSLSGGRVYVMDVGDAGGLIKTSGWIDQPIQIVSLGMDDGDPSDEPPAPKMTREERLAKLHSLVKKPTLTRGEQYFVLACMNDGISI